MSRAEPLITPEELQCLLGGATVRSSNSWRSQLAQLTSVQFGAALWLVKGVFLYAVLMGVYFALVAVLVWVYRRGV